MYFTNGDHRAFESLMWDKPGDQYDSGADGPYPECRSCRCHRPFWTYRFCLYPECPFTPGRMTAVGNALVNKNWTRINKEMAFVIVLD